MTFNMVNILGQTKPIKSILKSSTSFESKDSPSHGNLHQMSQKSLSEDNHSSQPARKAAKFDEMNILETLHPPDKDYGHMKIEEPKTPFNYYEEGEDTEGQCHGLDEDDVARRLGGDSSATLKVHQLLSDDEEDEEPEGEESKEKRKHFDAKRKAHYNEYYAVKLARKLMEEELVEDEEEEEAAPKSTDEEMRDLEVEEPQ